MSTTVYKVSKEDIDAIFEKATDQGSYIIALYRLTFPDFDELTKIDGWPRAGEAVRVYTAEKAHEWDKRHVPGVVPGGAWILNYGWGSANPEDNLGDWEVTTDGVEVIYD